MLPVVAKVSVSGVYSSELACIPRKPASIGLPSAKEGRWQRE